MQISKRLRLSLAILITALCPLLAWAQDPMMGLVAQERRFAEVCKQIGIRDSFLQFFDDKVITFGPDLRIGTDYLKSRPANTAASPKLEWHPSYGDVSAAGDLGFLTGPATLTLKPNDPSATKVLNLVYFSIWRKNPAGEWKVVFDGGLTIPTPLNEDAFHREPAIPKVRLIAVAASTQDLQTAELKFSELAAASGLVAALDEFAEPSIRVHRDNHLPVQGIVPAKELLNASGTQFSFTTREAVVATSGDLGYTYGDVTKTSPDSTPTKLGSFVRVWRRHKEGWKIALDMILPLE